MTITELAYCVWGGLSVIIVLGFTGWVGWKARREEVGFMGVLFVVLLNYYYDCH